MDEPEKTADSEDEKRRASIRYILRRRARASKQRANSGAVVKSWGEYQEVSFKPDGDSSWWGYLSVVVIIGLLAVLPFAYSKTRPAHEPLDIVPFWMTALMWGVGFILAAGLAACLVVFLSTCWRGLRAIVRRR